MRPLQVCDWPPAIALRIPKGTGHRPLVSAFPERRSSDHPGLRGRRLPLLCSRLVVPAAGGSAGLVGGSGVRPGLASPAWPPRAGGRLAAVVRVDLDSAGRRLRRAAADGVRHRVRRRAPAAVRTDSAGAGAPYAARGRAAGGASHLSGHPRRSPRRRDPVRPGLRPHRTAGLSGRAGGPADSDRGEVRAGARRPAPLAPPSAGGLLPPGRVGVRPTTAARHPALCRSKLRRELHPCLGGGTGGDAGGDAGRAGAGSGSVA